MKKTTFLNEKITEAAFYIEPKDTDIIYARTSDLVIIFEKLLDLQKKKCASHWFKNTDRHKDYNEDMQIIISTPDIDGE